MGARNLADVPIHGAKKRIARQSTLFQQWLARLDPRFVLRGVHVQAVDMVGTDERRRVLFAKLKADITDAHGNPLAGFAFLRGGSVTVLEILNCNDAEYCVLTIQPRVAAGVYAMPELPAGMLDGSNNFSGTAARELKEEAGIEIKAEDLFDLTEEAYGDKWPGVYLSPGGCDEFLRIFLDYRFVTRPFLAELHGKLTGIPEEHEYIALKVIPLGRLVAEAPDAKALCALALYNTLHAQGKLNSYLALRRRTRN